MDLSSLLPTRGGKARKDRKTRKASKSGKGVFASVTSPIRGLLRTATNIAESGLDTVYNVPATAVRGVKNTVRNSVKRLSSGVNNVVGKATAGVNSSISGVFSKKGRKNTRNTRNSRKNAHGGYKSESGESSIVVPFKPEAPSLGAPPVGGYRRIGGRYHHGGNQMLGSVVPGFAMEGFHMTETKANMAAAPPPPPVMKHPEGFSMDGFKDVGSPIAPPMPTKGGFRRTHA